LKNIFSLMLLSVFFAGLAQAEQANEPYLFVLGVGQDAGYPQIACYQPHCLPGWKNPALRRGATSIALIDPTSNNKYLFEATPNLPSQLFDLEQQAPSDRYRLNGVFLTHAHIGHYAGLMFFGHEAMGASKIPVYVMPKMQAFLRGNGPWSQLIQYENVALKPLTHEQPLDLGGGLIVTPFLVPHRDEFSETVGYRIKGSQKTALFIPDINKWSKWHLDLAQVIKTVDYALIDATFFGPGELPGRDMSKVPHPLVTESMELLGKLEVEHKKKVWFIHMNHTNPLLNSNSAEAMSVRAKGFNIAIEGLRLPL
jgi:pyrroloquinoline quinone biosynthesis protein B